MHAVPIIPWSKRSTLGTLAPDDMVLLVDDASAVWVVDPSRLLTLGFEILAAPDGVVVGGPARALSGMFADEPDSGMGETVIGLWNEGADFDLDHDHEFFCPIHNVRLRGAVVVAEDFPACVVYGPDRVVGALREQRRSNLRAVDDLAAQFVLQPPKVITVASEIVATPLIDSAWCTQLCQLVESFDAWESDPDDPVPGDEFSLHLAPALFDALERSIGTVLVPALRDEWPSFAWDGLADAFVIRYDAIEETSTLHLHHDVAQISMAIRLNDGYDGGALRFPRQRWDNGTLPIGTAAIWPSLVTHPHVGETVSAGRKYSLTVWFALPA